MAKKEVVPAETKALAHQSPANSLMLLIDRAATDPAFDVAKLEKLLDVKERWDREEARKAFVSALSAFKRNPPEIVKDKTVDFKTEKGRVSYRHATLGNVSALIGESLGNHGLSHRWDIDQKDGKIKVSCILTHDQGHSERVTLEAAADTSGLKNHIQAISSAVSYLQRYTLLSVTGMATNDESDDDGRKGADPQTEPAKTVKTVEGAIGPKPGQAPAKKDEKILEGKIVDHPSGRYAVEKVTKSSVKQGLFYVTIQGNKYATTDQKLAEQADAWAKTKTSIDFESEQKDGTQFLKRLWTVAKETVAA